jgi:hypothetical protein
MNRLGSERGQAAVLSVICLTALIGLSALVLDVGSWFRAQRDTQAAADAAALAAAQVLPNSLEANAVAAEYVEKNGGGNATVSFESKLTPYDTVRVRVERKADGFFAKVFGIDSVDVGANAAARTSGLESAKWVAPVVVNVKHPMLNCGEADGKPVPCFGEPTQLELLDLHSPGSRDAAGSFGLINLDRESGGNIGAGTLAGWMLTGFDEYMDIGAYDAAPSANFNNSQFRDALNVRTGDDLLFPIYSKITGPGSGAKYDVVGWVGFKVESFQAGGSRSVIRGSFTEVIWEGVQSDSGAGLNYGVKAIQLVE